MEDCRKIDLSDVDIDKLLLAVISGNRESVAGASEEEIIGVLKLRIDRLSLEELLTTLLVITKNDGLGLDRSQVFGALRATTKESMGDDVDAWMSWYLRTADSRWQPHKSSVAIQYRIYKAEQRGLNRLYSRHKK